MSGHDYHEALPGFDPEQIWKDGCAECEYRGQLPIHLQLDWLDPVRFELACRRALGADSAGRFPGSVSASELPLLRALCAVLRRLPASVSS